MTNDEEREIMDGAANGYLDGDHLTLIAALSAERRAHAETKAKLAAMVNAGDEWYRLVKKPVGGGYSPEEVVRACDAFHAAVESAR
jgi:hypothetical protein